MSTISTNTTPPGRRKNGVWLRGANSSAVIAKVFAAVLGFPRRLHRDERGTISIISVFAVMLLTMLLGMIINVGRQIDGKIKMQNAADASAYSGGVVLARGMNTLAFTNHLLSDVFAMTAFMREARDRNSEKYVPEILAAWAKIGPIFQDGGRRSGYTKFAILGAAITQKVPREQELVRSFNVWAAACSEFTLPLMEGILQEELIPQFQRAVVVSTPQLAQIATAEVARRHGLSSPARGQLQCVLWRTAIDPVGGGSESARRTLPVVDPIMDMTAEQAQYQSTARHRRDELAHAYLRDWNDQVLRFFDYEAKMCQFAGLWRGFTCGYLDELLTKEYPDRNLPHVIRTEGSEIVDTNRELEQDFMFLGVAYWPHLKETMPGLFRNPTDGDAMAFSQIMLFAPAPRLAWARYSHSGVSGLPIGGVPGEFPELPSDSEPVAPPAPDDGGHWVVVRQSRPGQWNLWSQTWTVKLVPANFDGLATLLQTPPPATAAGAARPRLPNLGGVNSRELGWINHH
jgi:hypothetical protein